MNNTFETALCNFSQADRILSEFLLNAMGREHRTTEQLLRLEAADYRTIWNRVLATPANNRVFDLKIQERGGSIRENSMRLSYSAHNCRFVLKIIKAGQ